MTYFTYLHDSFKHGDEDKFNEANLGCGLGDLFSVHEGCHGKALRFLSITLNKDKTA